MYDCRQRLIRDRAVNACLLSFYCHTEDYRDEYQSYRYQVYYVDYALAHEIKLN